MIATITKILDSTPFRIFFAVWTGVYLVQVIKKETGAPINELWWIVVAFAVTLFIL
jgi:hypothetical protein